MRFGPGRLVVLCGLVPTLVAALLSLFRPSFLSNWEFGTYDAILRATPTRPPGGAIVIVDIDDRSLTTVGQWPWRRDVISQLISRLRDLGASIVALDIMFAEPDRFEGFGTTPDETLAETLARGRVVLGYAMTFDGASDAASPCLLHPLGLAVMRRDDSSETPFFHATGTVCNLPVLTKAANASGFLNAAPDPDGLLRRIPVLIGKDGRVYPSLAVTSVMAVTGTRDATLRVANVNSSTLDLGGRSVPLDGQSNLLLRYRGPKRTFPYVSAVDVLRGQQAPDTFKDKIVLVGTTALGTREVVSTPFDTLFAGVEVQATVADNLLQQDSIQRPSYAVMLETQLVIVLGLASALLVRRFGLAIGAAGVAVFLALVWFGSIRLMATSGVYLSPLFPIMGLSSALAAMTVARFTSERQRADQAGEEKATSQRLMVQSLLSLTEVRDAETGRHSRRTQAYTRVLAKQLSAHPQFRDYLTPGRIELFASLAPLHDIGKVGVPDHILHKPGPLTPDEFVEMRKHPGYGRDVIVHAEDHANVHDDVILTLAKDIVYTHHEKWDGSGYPQGLRGLEIPIPGRVMAIVDVYDASTTRQLYRTPLSHDEAVAFIVKSSGSHFDPDVVAAFLEVAPQLRDISLDPDHAPA
jgi:HD-GYP domain-containing protein (c-di-GMP phosphodiesterase class II)